MSNLPLPETTNDRLDRLIYHLERMDRRDKWRTVGGFFRGIITIIPVFIVIASSWYFYNHSAEIIKQITEQAAQGAAKAAGSDTLMQQMNKYLKK